MLYDNKNKATLFYIKRVVFYENAEQNKGMYYEFQCHTRGKIL